MRGQFGPYGALHGGIKQQQQPLQAVFEAGYGAFSVGFPAAWDHFLRPRAGVLAVDWPEIVLYSQKISTEGG
jgi:hypothetical protein